MSAKSLRVVSVEIYGNTTYKLEQKSVIPGQWEPVKVLGVQPYFSSMEEAQEYAESLENGSEIKKVVSEFTVNI